jgi:hypothetical protein
MGKNDFLGNKADYIGNAYSNRCKNLYGAKRNKHTKQFFVYFKSDLYSKFSIEIPV